MRVNKNVIFYGMTELSDRIKRHGARSNFGGVVRVGGQGWR